MKLILQPFVYAGYAHISYDSWSPEATYYTELSGYSLGVYLDLLMPRISKRSALTIGAQYIKYEKKTGFRPDPDWNWSADISLLYNFFLVKNDIHQLSLFLGWTGFYAHSSYFSPPFIIGIFPTKLGISYRYRNAGIRFTVHAGDVGTSSYLGLSYYF